MTLRLGDTLIAGSGANQDLSNLTSQGQNIANWSTNVTNCITEIPQDIKLELNNGTLTLKAGSKIYVPNGFESDGTTPKFDIVIISSDITTLGYSNSNIMIFYYLSTNILGVRIIDDCVSGSSTTKTDYYNFYNTSTNKLGAYGASSTLESYLSLPICICKSNNGLISSIDHVFNGFGYIGSTVFALPNVKGLIPNGRNADGSLKNISFEISSVITSTLSYGEGEYYLGYIDGGYIGFLRETITHYLKDENLILDDITGIKHNDWMFFGSFYANSSNKITSFTSKTAFHALDYNDSSTVSGWGMPSDRFIDLTAPASGGSLIAPANGYFVARATASTGNYLELNTGRLDTLVFGSNGFDVSVYLPVKKGDVVTTYYSTTTPQFKFVYAEGEQ